MLCQQRRFRASTPAPAAQLQRRTGCPAARASHHHPSAAGAQSCCRSAAGAMGERHEWGKAAWGIAAPEDQAQVTEGEQPQGCGGGGVRSVHVWGAHRYWRPTAFVVLHVPFGLRLSQHQRTCWPLVPARCSARASSVTAGGGQGWSGHWRGLAGGASIGATRSSRLRYGQKAGGSRHHPPQVPRWPLHRLPWHFQLTPGQLRIACGCR